MIRTSMSFVLVLLLLPGCMTFGTPPPPPDLSSVAIATSGEPDLDLNAKTTLRRVLVGTGTGMGTGFVAGAVASFGIGLATAVPLMIVPPIAAIPLALGIVAAPFVGAVGAVIGGVVGATTGAVVGGLPRATAKQVNTILEDPDTLRDFTQELGTAVRANVPQSRQADRETALTVIAVELTNVDLVQYRSDELSIKMQAEAKYSWGHIQHAGHRRTQRKPTTATCTYEFETQKAHVDAFLADEGKAFEVAFTDAVNGVARQIAYDLNRGQAAPEDATADDAAARRSEACQKKLGHGR